MADNKQQRGRRQLLLLALVFFGPLLLAIAMYFSGASGLGQRSVNYGELLDPVMSIDAKLHFDTGTRGRWTLLLKPSANCLESCQRLLVDMRQVRLATGRELDRVERLLLTSESVADVQAIAQAHPGLVLLDNSTALGLSLNNALQALPAQHLYLMDPLGNVILRYSMAPDRKALLGDIKKLMKFSRIG